MSNILQEKNEALQAQIQANQEAMDELAKQLKEMREAQESLVTMVANQVKLAKRATDLKAQVKAFLSDVAGVHGDEDSIDDYMSVIEEAAEEIKADFETHKNREDNSYLQKQDTGDRVIERSENNLQGDVGQDVLQLTPNNKATQTEIKKWWSSLSFALKAKMQGQLNIPEDIMSNQRAIAKLVSGFNYSEEQLYELTNSGSVSDPSMTIAV